MIFAPSQSMTCLSCATWSVTADLWNSEVDAICPCEFTVSYFFRVYLMFLNCLPVSPMYDLSQPLHGLSYITQLRLFDECLFVLSFGWTRRFLRVVTEEEHKKEEEVKIRNVFTPNGLWTESNSKWKRVNKTPISRNPRKAMIRHQKEWS